MRFLTIKNLSGPNIWSSASVLEARVDLAELKDLVTREVPGLNDRLVRELARLDAFRRGQRDRGSFEENLRKGTHLADVLAWLSLELQALDGSGLETGWVRPTAERGVFRVAITHWDEKVGRACLESARDFCVAAALRRDWDVAAEAQRLRDLALDRGLGVVIGEFVEAARRRDIPWCQPDKDRHRNLIVLGQGARQRRCFLSKSDCETAVAETISNDKVLTKEFLKLAGIPVPEGRIVADAGEAWEVARALGPPIVVKPLDADFGLGVAVNLTTREQVEAAYAAALIRGESVLVEKLVSGGEYRLFVAGQRLIAAVHREPPQVVGDGDATVARLVDLLNQDPDRGDGLITPLFRIVIDPTAMAVLAEQGYTPDSVPASGTPVLIRRNTHRKDGGTVTDVTERVHPEVAVDVVNAARMVGLDVAGIDVVTRDIGRPLRQQAGAIIEVNAEPALRMHMRPTRGTPRPVARAVIERMLPEGEDGRIPCVAVTGDAGSSAVTRTIARLVNASGKTVGMVCEGGIFVAGRRVAETGGGAENARTILLNPAVEAAVLETPPRMILDGGLGFDRCAIAVVTGTVGMEPGDDPTPVESTVVKHVARNGATVLNAGDPSAEAMASASPAPVIYYTRDADHPVVLRHRDRGGKVVFVREGSVVVAEGKGEDVVVSLTRVPAVDRTRDGLRVEDLLAALAAAWGMGIDHETIRSTLESSAGDPDDLPL